jgi:hypothetical protein
VPAGPLDQQRRSASWKRYRPFVFVAALFDEDRLLESFVEP